MEQQEGTYWEEAIRHLRTTTVSQLTVRHPLVPVRSFYTANRKKDLLEMSIVSADGEHDVINRYSDPEYFWAVRGGGGSAWGVRERTLLSVAQLRLTIDKFSDRYICDLQDTSSPAEPDDGIYTAECIR